MVATPNLENTTPEEIELYVLSSLRSVAQVSEAVDAGVRTESFQVDDHKRAWEYLAAKARDGFVPTLGDIEAVTGVALYVDLEDQPTYRDELVNRTIYRLAIDRILEIEPKMRDKAAPELEHLIGSLADIVQKTQTKHLHDHVGDVNERRQRVIDYANHVKHGGVVGIPTGLPVLDKAGDTWRPGELISIQGPLNVGKSTLLLWFCAYTFHFSGKKVLFLSPEMSVEEVELRLDPMLARFMGYVLSNRALRAGKQDLDVWNAYCDALDATGRRGEWTTRDSGEAGYFTVNEIISMAREHRPDVLAIDGIHLIRGKGKTWETMKDASERLKGLAQSQSLLIFGNTQVQRDAVVASDDASDLAQGAYGMAFSEAADKVISIAERRGDPTQRVWKLIKNRTGRRLDGRQFLRFDVDSGTIGDILHVENETGEVEEIDL